MTEPKCSKCGDTGHRMGSEFLDCTACDAATERAAMNAAVREFDKVHPGAAWYDERNWFIHQRATAAAEAKIAARIEQEIAHSEANDLRLPIGLGEKEGRIAVPAEYLRAAAPIAAVAEQTKQQEQK